MAVAKPVALCVVSVNHVELVMPSQKGLKLVELVQHAKVANLDYHSIRERMYDLGDTPEVEYRAVKHSQIRTPGNAPAGRVVKGQTLLLGRHE